MVETAQNKSWKNNDAPKFLKRAIQTELLANKKSPARTANFKTKKQKKVEKKSIHEKATYM